jgi:hypothetical protein
MLKSGVAVRQSFPAAIRPSVTVAPTPRSSDSTNAPTPAICWSAKARPDASAPEREKVLPPEMELNLPYDPKTSA